MNNNILDDISWKKNDVKSLNDIKKALTEAGISSFYEHKNGTIIVQQGDAVKVVIHFENGDTLVKPNFPRIGNSMQVLISAILLFIFIFVFPVVFPMQWIIAFFGGQIASYFIHTPRTKRLKEKIERYI